MPHGPAPRRVGAGVGRWVGMLACAGLLGCSSPLPVAAFADSPPALDPVRFFTGHVVSWGVMEDRSGAPTSIVTTDCVGAAQGTDGLSMTQTLHVGTDPAQTRTWQMRRVGPGRFEATANDMVGIATGEAAGRAFHWQWTLALQPGNALKNVTMEQWWYLLDDSSMLNRTTVSKLGVIAAEVTEHFVAKP